MAQPAADRVLVRRGVSWERFARLLAKRGDDGTPKIKYLDGVLELVTPSREHNRQGSWIGSLVETYALARGIDLSSFGNWTIRDKRQRAGLEPDDCFIFGRDEKRYRRPHLAIEIQWSRTALNKLEIYRRLGIREVWLWRKPGVITVHLFRRGTWCEVARSPRFPELDLAWLCTFLDRPSMTQAMRELRVTLEA